MAQRTRLQFMRPFTTRYLVDPELYVDPARRDMPLPVRLVLGLMNVTEFLRMRVERPG